MSVLGLVADFLAIYFILFPCCGETYMYAEADNSALETKVEALVRRIEKLEATVEKQSAITDKQTIIIQRLLHKSEKGEFHFDFDKMNNVSVKTDEKLLLHYIKVIYKGLWSYPVGTQRWNNVDSTYWRGIDVVLTVCLMVISWLFFKSFQQNR